MTRIGCAGMLVEDTFCGPFKALPPEGQLLELEAMPVRAGGCAANVAIDLAKQGLHVEVVGCLGRDSSAEVLLNCLRDHGVDCEQVALVGSYPTSKTVILLVEGQDRRYLHVFGSNRAFTVGHINRDWVKNLSVLYIGGLCALPAVAIGELRELLQFCREHKVATVVDVVVSQSWTGAEELKVLLPCIDYFLPNHDEARIITGELDALDQLRAFRAIGSSCVVITQGKSGAVAMKDGHFWKCGSYPVDCIDPSGSGDAFSAGTITGIVNGWAMPQILRYSSALGASATRAVGTTGGVFSSAEAEEFVASHLLKESGGTL
jgi:sugar/nucleoside kinase (ribokinase family)